MLENNSKLLFLLLFLLGGIELCLSTEFVPVFMWETQNSVQPSPALQRINEKDFYEILVEKSKTKPLVVVFAEETLSPEDFAQHNKNGKTSFKALHKLLASTNVGYKPYVQNPIGAIKQLEKGITEISIASLLRNFNVPKDEVLIVDLNDAKDDEDRQDMLRRHDTAISQVFEKLLANADNILAIYTAHHPSWVTPEEVKHRNIRSLLQENEAVKTSTESDQKKTQEGETSPENESLKAATNQKGITITDSKWLLLHVLSKPRYSKDEGKTFNQIDLTTTSCESKNNVINLKLSDGTNSFTFLINLQNDGYWALNSVSSDANQFSYPEITAPFGFSYQCFNVTFRSDKQILILPGMQIQPFTDTQAKDNNVFGDPYNCVGFTSIPIWSGIIITIILLLILTFGITLMMDIRTMDKFDDAKGKSITINASE